MAKLLCLGEWLEDSCESEGFSYYEAEVTSNDSEIIFLYSINSVEPTEDIGDPDLYISTNGTFPDFSNPYSANYSWKSTLFGTDSISLLPGNPLYIRGLYKLSVFNSRPCKFRLKYYTLRVPKEVNFPYRQHFTQEEYFKCSIKHPGLSRIEIIVKNAPAAVFLSFSFTRPNLNHHAYSQGYNMPNQDVAELDPFPNFPLSFVYFTSQYSQRYPENDEIRICVDTESKNDTVFFTVAPLKSGEQELEIFYQEVYVETLVPAELRIPFSRFSAAFGDVDTNLLSLADRKAQALEYSLEFTYGEIEFFNYALLLDIVKPKNNEVIWDLGSGAGKSVLVAALLYPNVKVVGVEFLPQLCNLCQSVTKDLDNVSIICGDIRNQDWSNSDIIYMSSLCFLDDLMDSIIYKCSKCKQGTRVLTLREFPINTDWTLTNSVRVLMSWGRSNCFIYTKN